MKPKQYRKKPVVIEAVHVSPDSKMTLNQIADWCGGKVIGETDKMIMITTLEGIMTAQQGDYIIKGVQGEFYPCKPDIFEATYEAADLTHGEEFAISKEFLLNLIEQSKDKSLPLTWLAGEIKKL